MLKKLLLAAQLLLVAFLVKFLDADSDCGDSDSGDSDSGSSEGSGEFSSSSSEDSDSPSDSNSSQKKPKIIPKPEDLLNLNPEDLSQIPRR